MSFDMEDLKLFKVTSKANIKVTGNFRSGFVFANDAEDAFSRMMNHLNKTHEAAVFSGQQFNVTQIPIPDSLVFGIEIDLDKAMSNPIIIR